MRERYSLSDWLLLGIAGFLDFLDEIKDPGGIIKNYYETFYGGVPIRFRKATISSIISQSLKNKRLKRVIKKRKIYYFLSENTREELIKKYPLLSIKNRQWDKKWRIVVFDIEEKERKTRNFLRRQLKLMGFGQLQKSVWLSPYDFLPELKRLISSYQLQNKVILIETKKLDIFNYLYLVKKLWPIESLNKCYHEILIEIKKLKYLNQENYFKKINRIRKKFIEVYYQDPCLPKEFLPKDWLGNRVKRLIRKLKIF